MKEKIEMIYGKKEAESFEGSSNWFQWFKKKARYSTEKKNKQEEKLC